YRSQIRLFDVLKVAPAAYGDIRQKVEEYAKEKTVIEADAGKAKTELERLNGEADQLFSAGASMDYGVGLAQLAITIVSLVVLTHQVALLIAGSTLLLPCLFFILNSYMVWIK